MTLLFALFTAAAVLAGSSPTPTEPSVANHLLDGFEAQLAQDPSSLRVAAEYRQLIIETGRYDRSIKLFERLARDPRGGANRFLNLALANVDKVPVSGSVRRALLGRDALDALTHAIAIEPTDLAYLIRGLVNLYYDQIISPGRLPLLLTASSPCWRKEKAAAGAAKILANAQEEAARDRARLRAELTREVGRLVVQTSAAVTGKVLTPYDQRRLFEEAAHQLSAP